MLLGEISDFIGFLLFRFQSLQNYKDLKLIDLTVNRFLGNRTNCMEEWQ